MNLEFTNAKGAKEVENLQKGENYALGDFGNWEDLNGFVSENTELNLKTNGKIFLKNILNLTGSEISLNYIPKETKTPFLHTHKENEEVYIVLKGKGEFVIDENIFAIKEGSIIKVSPNAKRGINSTNEDLIIISIQTKQNSLSNYTLTDAEIQ